jgi:antirestriction protein ArdC
MRQDVYQRVTDRIVSELEKGVHPWLKPWHVEHVAGKITRPLRATGIPYQGINVFSSGRRRWKRATPRRSG